MIVNKVVDHNKVARNLLWLNVKYNNNGFLVKLKKKMETETKVSRYTNFKTTKHNIKTFCSVINHFGNYINMWIYIYYVDF